MAKRPTPDDDAAVADRVRTVVPRSIELTDRLLFGGRAFYHRGPLFALVYRGELFLRVDERTRTTLAEAGSEPFRPHPGRTLRTYWRVPEGLLGDRRRLRPLVESAIRVSAQLGRGRPASARGRRRA